MMNVLKLILSYFLMGLPIVFIARSQIKQVEKSMDNYFQEKFDGFEAKDIFLEEGIKNRLDKVCKSERRQRNDQINLILDEWLTEYENVKREKERQEQRNSIKPNHDERNHEEWKAAREQEGKSNS